jgi:hypothetical protein
MNSTVIQILSGGSPTLLRGRLIFAVDATASREKSWTVARELQAQMFRAAAPIGQLNLQLVFYRGESCPASKWTTSGEHLAHLMRAIECEAGETQIERVLRHVLREQAKAPVQAATLIGDAMEESFDTLSGLAGQLGVAGVPVFTFLEGNDPMARRAFRMIALRSGGAFYEFNVNSKQAISHLSEQLGAVAAYAAGGLRALSNVKGQAATKLLEQLK